MSRICRAPAAVRVGRVRGCARGRWSGRGRGWVVAAGCARGGGPVGTYAAGVIRIARITPASELYPGEVALREAVLLEPIGYDMDRFRAAYPGVEERAEHFVAVLEHTGGPRVVGCALLLPPGAGKEADGGGLAKLMQMAVDPQRQGEGIGRRLVVAAEARAFGELGLVGLYCHAQDRAIGFYEKLGWRGEGEDFVEADVPHRKMVVHAPPKPPEGVSGFLRRQPADDAG